MTEKYQNTMIPLSKGMYAVVSPEDVDRVNKFKWCASQEGEKGRKWYAIRWMTENGKRTKIRMHRFILGLGTGFEDSRIVNHLNNDGLDNRRKNLEILSNNYENMSKCDNWKINEKAEDDPWL